ncbi:MAG: hypothetical protein RLZZ450_3772 [Pseudomonadota bacterium]|jgi:cell division protein FtsQ
MARDSDAGARVKPRRASAALDPNRSTMRRVSNRRVGRGSVPPPRVSLTPRSSLVGDDASAPRNRRVPRQKRAQPGPKLATRVWLWLVALVHGGAQLLSTRALALRARLRGAPALPGAEASASTDEEIRAAEGEAAQGPVGARPHTSRLMQVITVCLAMAGVWGLARFVQRHLTTAPAFAIDAIDVKGLARVDRAELLSAAGLELGLNVFARSPEDVRARLLRHPWILSAKVERKLPSRFAITIQERAPVALLVVEACSTTTAKSDDDPACDEASSLYLVSADAKLFKRLSGKDPVDLPVITGVARQRFASDPDLQRRILVEAVLLMHAYRNSGLWQQNPLGEIHLEANDGYSLYVGEDLTYVRLGAAPFDQKLLRMKKVFERLEREHARAEYVYLDNEQRPDRVAVKLR